MGSTEADRPIRLPPLTVWDGREEIGVRCLVLEGDRIVSLEGAPEANDRELAVIPGLIDTHVHLVGNAAATPADFATWPLVTTREEQVLHGVAHATTALHHGVTTLRDLAGDEAQIAMRRAFDSGVLVGPRLLVHGVVGMTGGHADLFIPPAVAERKPVADGEAECRRLVRHWARAGMDGIKITTSGGVLSIGDKSRWRNYTRGEIAAIVDEAHALGLPVAAHAHTGEGVAVAIAEGVDSVEHATLLEPEQAEELAKRGTTVAPTLLINDAIAAGSVPVSNEAREKAAELVADRDERLRYAAACGVEFVLGTDANGHHVRFGDEMAELVAMGELFDWSPARALAAGTSRAAAALRLGGRVGTLAPGFCADLLVVRGRPWERFEDLRTDRIVAVVSRGRVVAGALP